MIKTIKFQISIVILLFISSIFVFAVLFHVDNKYQTALESGIGYNILQQDISEVYCMVDGWEYYPGALLMPEDFLHTEQTPYYTYIGQYPNFSAHLGTPYGTATYRIQLYNPAEPQMVSLYLPELFCTGRVYINGTLVGTQGSITPYQPLVEDTVYSFLAQEKTEIVIQSANQTHYYSGMYYPPVIGSPQAILQMVICRMLIYGFLCFTALAIALSQFALWLRSKDTLTRSMGLLCLCFALRMTYPFLRALGVPSIRPLYAVEDLCANLVLLCALVLMGALTHQTTQWVYRNLAMPIMVGICVFSVIFPMFILPYTPDFINLYGFLLFLWKLVIGWYVLYLAAYGVYIRQPFGLYLLCATGIYAVSLIWSLFGINRFEPIYGAWTEEYGAFILVIGFVVCMVQHMVTLSKQNERLTEHLQEEVARKTDALESLLAERRELLAQLIHDLKNPITAVRNYADLVRAHDVGLDIDTAKYLQALSERAEAMGDRFALLQSFSRGERGKFAYETIPLCDFLRQFYERNRPDIELLGQEFLLHLPKKQVYVAVDTQRLQIALENLCYNALSFTPEYGKIELSLQVVGSRAQIAVADTGAGIAAEDLAHVFERGFTCRADGSGEGLGLFIVQTIALEHGGSVDVTSEKGKGSTFYLYLPVWTKSDTAE